MYVVKHINTGDKLTYKPVTAIEGVRSILMLHNYSFGLYVTDDDGRVTATPGILFQIIMMLSEDDLRSLLNTLFNEVYFNDEKVDYDDLFAADYGLMLTCLHEIFMNSFGDFFTLTAKPFIRPKFTYDSGTERLLTPNVTQSAVKKAASLDLATEIIHSVYFSPMNKESLEYLMSMPFGDFWKLKTAIEIRESQKQELDYNNWVNSKPKANVFKGGS